MGGKERMESLPAEWVVNIEGVATDTSAETQAKAKAPDNNETQKEEERPRDIEDANKSIQNPIDLIHLVCGRQVQICPTREIGHVCYMFAF